MHVRLDADERCMHFKAHGIKVHTITALPGGNIRCISAAAFNTLRKVSRRDSTKKLHVFSASLADIEKALRPKEPIDPKTKSPKEYWGFLPLFDNHNAESLPPLRGKGIDHEIELVKGPDGREPEVPAGPLYNMSRDELLLLRKTLNDLLDKGFIHVSASPAAAPILFVKKPGGGLRFCVDYRALNNITRKDRYPLPLVNETLERIGQANWFTKLDVVAAFHKLRIAEGSEWMTAFRTRYGLYEWLVTPFGLANAPSSFQKYINWAVRDFLDEVVSAYLDDVLIFTTGSLTKHRQHVVQVLARLQEAGLYLDIRKCEFEVQATKYLGFIIEAGRGVRMDPEKINAILAWESPKSVKEVRGFIGFANFYRRFIKDISFIADPLIRLTKKNTPFVWSSTA